MAFRAYFSIWLPPTTATAVHTGVTNKLNTWAGKIKHSTDTGAEDPDGRTITLRLHLAEGAGDVVRDFLLALVAVEPGVRIERHSCPHGIEDGPCTSVVLYPAEGA
jgi:hypothetical protein